MLQQTQNTLGRSAVDQKTKESNRKIGIVAAVLLSVLTLTVFYRLQDYGPESALRKFHVASVNGDWRTLSQVTIANVPEDVLVDLQKSVSEIARAGGRYEMRQIVRTREKAQALVVYSLPFRGQEVPHIWVVTKESGRWKVNPGETARQAWRRSLKRTTGFQ